MSARAFAQSHSTGHSTSEYQSHCPGNCCSCCNAQRLLLGKEQSISFICSKEPGEFTNSSIRQSCSSQMAAGNREMFYWLNRKRSWIVILSSNFLWKGVLHWHPFKSLKLLKLLGIAIKFQNQDNTCCFSDHISWPATVTFFLSNWLKSNKKL